MQPHMSGFVLRSRRDVLSPERPRLPTSVQGRDFDVVLRNNLLFYADEYIGDLSTRSSLPLSELSCASSFQFQRS